MKHRTVNTKLSKFKRNDTPALTVHEGGRIEYIFLYVFFRTNFIGKTFPVCGITSQYTVDFDAVPCRIPAEIFVSNLIKKYSFVAKPWEIKAIIGEYDDPNNQRQDLLTLDFNDGGNTLIYGVSGKEIMLSTIIYSLITTHTSDELNIYIIDFGSEMFGTFKAAPQIGDVVFINEAEKLNNLFSIVQKELEVRKKLFADYNGSYNLYIKNSGNKVVAAKN